MMGIVTVVHVVVLDECRTVLYGTLTGGLNLGQVGSRLPGGLWLRSSHGRKGREVRKAISSLVKGGQKCKRHRRAPMHCCPHAYHSRHFCYGLPTYTSRVALRHVYIPASIRARGPCHALAN